MRDEIHPYTRRAYIYARLRYLETDETATASASQLTLLLPKLLGNVET